MILHVQNYAYGTSSEDRVSFLDTSKFDPSIPNQAILKELFEAAVNDSPDPYKSAKGVTMRTILARYAAVGIVKVDDIQENDVYLAIENAEPDKLTGIVLDGYTFFEISGAR